MTYKEYYININCKVLRETEKAFLLLTYPNFYEIWMPKKLVKDLTDKSARVYQPVFDQNVEKFIKTHGERKPFQFDFQSKKSKNVSIELNEELIKKLLILCHPDKHGNSDTAVEITKIILEYRNKIN